MYGMAGERRRSAFPGFDEVTANRRALAEELVAQRVSLGLSQTEVAARMGTSQSAVARLESGDADIRLSTLERYAAALGRELSLSLRVSKRRAR
jgi:predicted transcriptional regulator